MTFPGGIIAHQIKRKDLLGAIVLSVAGAALGIIGIGQIISGFGTAGWSYVISGVFFIAVMIAFAFIFRSEKKWRIISCDRVRCDFNFRSNENIDIS